MSHAKFCICLRLCFLWDVCNLCFNLWTTVSLFVCQLYSFSCSVNGSLSLWCLVFHLNAVWLVLQQFRIHSESAWTWTIDGIRWLVRPSQVRPICIIFLCWVNFLQCHFRDVLCGHQNLRSCVVLCTSCCKLWGCCVFIAFLWLEQTADGIRRIITGRWDPFASLSCVESSCSNVLLETSYAVIPLCIWSRPKWVFQSQGYSLHITVGIMSHYQKFLRYCQHR